MNQFGGALFDAPQPSDWIVALGLAVAISVIFAIAAPFAAVPLVRIAAFIPAYESAVIINDLATAAVFTLLFLTRGTRGLLFLAAGYLWTALLAAAHLLSFPGLFPGLLRAGPQTTAWIYMAWHIGFPVTVILYAAAGGRVIRARPLALTVAGAAVVVIVTGLVVLSTSGHGLLPVIMDADHELPLASLIAGSICLVAAGAMGWVLGGPTRLDLWLAVVSYAWIGDVLLSAVFNTGRYDLGWYAGRVFGFLAVSLVLSDVLVLAGTRRYPRSSR